MKRLACLGVVTALITFAACTPPGDDVDDGRGAAADARGEAAGASGEDAGDGDPASATDARGDETPFPEGGAADAALADTGSDSASDEATMPAIHFVIGGGDSETSRLGGYGGLFAYTRLAIERFIQQGAGRRMAVGLTVHPRWPLRHACSTDAYCGQEQCSINVQKYARTVCCDEQTGCHECGTPAGSGVGLCPGTTQLCTGRSPSEELIAGRESTTCADCDFTPFCMVSPLCLRGDYARPDVSLAPAARTGAAVIASLRAFVPGGGVALEGAYKAASSHAVRYAAAHPNAPVAIVVIDAGGYSRTPCFSPTSRLEDAAAAAFGGEGHVRTFTIQLGYGSRMAALGGGFEVTLGRYSQVPLSERLDAALAKVAAAVEPR
ncbi:MAG: hypothetical protein JST00_33510 [Deltaproteobacteria bacterium]|nr:hypothetical protein [Deltaproteobacteria bacterium]